LGYLEADLEADWSFRGVFRFRGGLNYLEADFLEAVFLEAVSWRRIGIWRRILGALFILGRVCFQKYQFEIYLLESVLQSFLTDGPGVNGVKIIYDAESIASADIAKILSNSNLKAMSAVKEKKKMLTVVASNKTKIIDHVTKHCKSDACLRTNLDGSIRSEAHICKTAYGNIRY
jgi:hypothetical protein